VPRCIAPEVTELTWYMHLCNDYKANQAPTPIDPHLAYRSIKTSGPQCQSCDDKSHLSESVWRLAAKDTVSTYPVTGRHSNSGTIDTYLFVLRGTAELCSFLYRSGHQPKLMEGCRRNDLLQLLPRGPDRQCPLFKILCRIRTMMPIEAQ
jgi:hypothetical protein